MKTRITPFALIVFLSLLCTLSMIVGCGENEEQLYQDLTTRIDSYFKEEFPAGTKGGDTYRAAINKLVESGDFEAMRAELKRLMNAPLSEKLEGLPTDQESMLESMRWAKAMLEQQLNKVAKGE
ncbi:MAG: hypothetical protein KKB70_08350 [Proteobacteria bacterium]|nr:hypothetical protein [Pseudomonadota bacterium]